MKAIISTTYDDKYLFFIPICVWAWNKLGVDVICFMPDYEWDSKDDVKFNVVAQYLCKMKCDVYSFKSPKHKEATYAQCSRLYAACLDLPEDEILVTGDVDMAMFKLPVCYPMDGYFTIFGSDLVPPKQFPICYISASVKDWRNAFNLHKKTYQQKLDELLSHIEADHFRGNYWGKDQEEAYNKISLTQGINYEPRSNGQNQFATKRYDRDDTYILERLNPDTIDFHMNRPGYEEKNFEIIMTVLKYHYPNDKFDWLISYREQYIKLL